jgi:hypothetical protein
MARPPETETRLGPARHRAAMAKLVLAAAGASVFLVAGALARVAYPGHAKRGSRDLSAPPRFVQIVRQNQLEAGILAPTQAPPVGVSGSS